VRGFPKAGTVNLTLGKVVQFVVNITVEINQRSKDSETDCEDYFGFHNVFDGQQGGISREASSGDMVQFNPLNRGVEPLPGRPL
jgi:hypothetical protein